MNENPGASTTPPSPAAHDADRRRLRRIAVRVVIVQALALIALWLLQARYHGAP